MYTPGVYKGERQKMEREQDTTVRLFDESVDVT